MTRDDIVRISRDMEFGTLSLEEALKHYQSKYGVVRLYSAPNLNGVNTRKLLSIF